MANASEIKNYLDNELKPDKLGTKFEEINENAINLFQRLFVEYLNYDLVQGDFGEIGVDILSDNWSNAAEAEEAYLIAEKEEFRVIYILIKKLTKGRERYSINSIKRLKWAKKREYICIFYARDSLVWDLVCPHIDEEKIILRRFILGDGENHRTVSKNLSFMDASESKPLFDRVQEAFKVQPVTNAFFEDYKKSFFLLKKELAKQGIPKKEAHEFTLQLLNRIMFIYFISKKEGWLNTKNFIGWLWKIYCEQGKRDSDEFYEYWLKQIFFKAFNNRANEIIGLPKKIIEAVNNFPFLNGGLFTFNELDKLKLKINDSLFFKIFNFFEDYNFTIREDSRFDVEVAVDPQMIGYVYESLANVAEEIYDRHDLGIFYTPRIEVDFMARRSLIEYLSNKLPNLNKEHIYHLVFDIDQKEKSKSFQDENFWYKLEEILDDLSVVDPACGSGAFLVGMLNVLTELYKLIYNNIKIKRDITDFGLKKRIIQYSLYGVDIMPWAIHAAELRLWLQLMVETELKKEDLRRYPLLPNLDLNLRIGDSLVQEIGGIFFNLRNNEIDEESKKRLLQMKQEKRNYFNSSPSARFATSDEIRQEEIRIFKNFIEKRISNIKGKINEKQKEIIREKGQKQLLSDKKVYDREKVKNLKEFIKDLRIRMEKLEKINYVLDSPEKKPFIWDVDFAEIFGEKNGFDIVIGNPPYVRYQNIIPFTKLKSEVSFNEKNEYKNKLVRSVKNQFPNIKIISKRSDYYIYFYFHGLSLLNERGCFCFITSNSWLDAKFGKYLQEFLIKYVPIISIYDTPERTFEHAGINTVIVLFGSPYIQQESIVGLKVIKETDWTQLDHIAKFIMFNKTYEDIINSKNLIEIDKLTVKQKSNKFTELVKNVVIKEEFRVFPIYQENLLKDGWKYPKKNGVRKNHFKYGKYIGNQWGVKYLRAPNIFYKLLKKGNFKKLKEFGNIETYLNTGGADKFYFVNKVGESDREYSRIKNIEFNEEFEIESKFLKPFVKSSRALNKILIDEDQLLLKLIFIDEDEDISKLKIKNYIDYGIEKGYNKRSGPSQRIPWWRLPKQAKYGSEILFPTQYHTRLAVYYNPKGYITGRFYRFNTKRYQKLIKYLNSTINLFMMELYGRKNLGEGALDIQKPELSEMPILDFEEIKYNTEKFFNRRILDIYSELQIDPEIPLKQQIPKPLEDRKALDNEIFDYIGLDQEERIELYNALCELVNLRLNKANTFKN